MTMRLVQLIHPAHGRRVGRVDQDSLSLLKSHSSVYGFAFAALETRAPLIELLANDPVESSLDYDPVHLLRTEWKFLPSFDQPNEPARCLVTGTGLTHLA